MIKIRKFSCGCEQKLYLNDEGGVDMVKWLNFCDKHKFIRRRL